MASPEGALFTTPWAHPFLHGPHFAFPSQCPGPRSRGRQHIVLWAALLCPSAFPSLHPGAAFPSLPLLDPGQGLGASLPATSRFTGIRFPPGAGETGEFP